MPKIIVGIDESDRSKDAVVLASQLARGSHAELILVCAYPYGDSPSRVENPEYTGFVKDDAEAAIERAQEGLRNLPQVVASTIAESSPAKAIDTIVAREEASLIVVGSSHRGTVGRVLAGTTAERLLHGSPCPVAVAPNGFASKEERAVWTITVAYNGSEESKAALTGAIAVARALDAQLRIVEVLDMAWVGTPALMSGPGYIAPPRELEQRARENLQKFVAGLPADVEAGAGRDRGRPGPRAGGAIRER